MGFFFWFALVWLAEAPALPNPGTFGSHKVYVRLVTTAKNEAFQKALSVYDEHLAKVPRDDIAAVERCRMIGALISEDETEGGEELESLYSQCREKLAGDFPHSAAVILYRLEMSWGDEACGLAEQMLESNEVSFSPAELARIYEKIARVRFAQNRQAEAARAAAAAMQLDEKIDLTNVIAANLMRQQKTREAIEALVSRIDDGQPYERVHKIRALAEAGAYGEAARALDRLPADESRLVDPLLRGTILEGVGLTEQARQAYSALDTQWNRSQVLGRLLAIDLSGRDADAASRSYQALRDLGWSADPLARWRLALTWHFPGSAWRLRDLWGLLCLMIVIVFFLIFPLVWIFPVHYASLWRQVRAARTTPAANPAPAPGAQPAAAREPNPSAPPSWGLGAAWVASAMVLTGQALGLYIFAYPEVQSWFDPGQQSTTSLQPSSLAAFGLVVVGASLLTLPVLLGRRRYREIFGPGLWSTREALKAASRNYGIVLMVVIVYYLAGKTLLGNSDAPLAGGTLTATAVVMAMGKTYGLPALLLVVAGIVPIAEEFVFRSVILGACTRHLPLRWVNPLQALLFTLMHDNPTAMPIVFVVGLLAGRLRQRSGGLLASIVLHALNNGIAVLVLWRGIPA